MGFVPTAEDVRELREYFSRPRFIAESLSVRFRTDERFVRETLPPCLDPAGEPVGFVVLSRWQTRGIGDFAATEIYLMASMDGVEGIFPIASFYGDGNNTCWNREVWGEGGKVADTRLFADGDRRWAYTERAGTRIVEIEGELGPDHGAKDEQGHYFEVKMLLSAHGGGLEFDPVLIQLDETDHFSSFQQGLGRISLCSSKFDPLGEIPVLDVGEATFGVSTTTYRISRYEPQPNRDAYLPWAYGPRYWDDPRLLPLAPRFRD